MSGDHDQGIVLLSVLLAVAASYTALDVADRMRAAPKGPTRAVWFVAAASTLGGGIWSMHFVAMLAFSMPGMAIRYDLGLSGNRMPPPEAAYPNDVLGSAARWWTPASQPRPRQRWAFRT